jgi:DNA-binding transcriptional MerR regulator
MQDFLGAPQPLRLFPEKLFYKIGEVSRLAGVEAYVLRYWETEFPFLSPRKSKSGQRVYTKKDVDLVLQIKHLLYEEGYTIDGVRRKLGIFRHQTQEQPVAEDEKGPNGSYKDMADADARYLLRKIKQGLKDILSQSFGA